MVYLNQLPIIFSVIQSEEDIATVSPNGLTMSWQWIGTSDTVERERTSYKRGECNPINGSGTLKLAEYIVTKGPE